MTVECFMIEPTLTWRKALRRFRAAPRIPGHVHDTHVVIGEVRRRSERSRPPVSGKGLHDPDDPRWPKRCACGYRFPASALKQLTYDQLWVNTVTGEQYPLWEAPPGAMWNSTWLPDSYRGSDGLALTLKLPGGTDWPMDGEASGGGHWERSGTPPRITVRPSINVGEPGEPWHYHGFVTDGIIGDHSG